MEAIRPTILATTMLLGCLLFLPFSAAHAEEKQATNTLESATQQSGRFLRKEIFDIGKVPVEMVSAVTFQVVVVTDLRNNEVWDGVRFSYSPKSAFVDRDDVDSIVEALSYIASNVLPTTPTAYTEYEYNCRSGVSVGCYWSEGVWKAYLQWDKLSDPLTVRDDSLPSFIKAFGLCQKRLKGW